MNNFDTITKLVTIAVKELGMAFKDSAVIWRSANILRMSLTNLVLVLFLCCKNSTQDRTDCSRLQRAI